MTTVKRDGLMITNGHIQLTSEGDDTAFGPYRLIDVQTGMEWANAPRQFRVEVGTKSGNRVTETIEFVKKKQWRKGNCDMWTFTSEAVFNAADDINCHIEITLRIPEQGNWFEERIRLRNAGTSTLQLANFNALWQRTLTDDSHINYLPVPFEPSYRGPLPIPLWKEEFICRRDGAVLLQGNAGLVISKEPRDCEPQWLGVQHKDKVISFAGVSDAVAQDLPYVEIEPNKHFDCGTTHYIMFEGAVEDGLLLHRDFMRQHGIGFPADYAPPINYCIFYECEMYYHHEQLLDALNHAAELGCTLLYTDQGWEDYFGTGKWDETRLGKLEAFVATARDKGMDVGVLVGMHARAYVWPETMWRKDQNGNVLVGDRHGPGNPIGICPTVPQWQRTKTRRLKKLVDAGVSFFSFDFNDFTDTCWDPTHPHTLPLRGWDHSAAVAKQQAMVKKACPQVLIEAHDWHSAGGKCFPIYLFSSSCDECWGFEYMWKTLEDFKDGALFNLYYYALAYDKPLYLHINLTQDNEHAVAFWYIASTVRHLGVGNYAALPSERKALARDVLSIYRKHQTFFSRGHFYGLDPLTHIHTLSGQGAIVLRFNNQPNPCKVRFSLTAEQVGAAEGSMDAVALFGPKPKQEWQHGVLSIEVELQGYAVTVLRVDKT